MKEIWGKIKYDPGNEPVEIEETAQEDDVIPILENMSEEDFSDKALAEQSAKAAVEIAEDKKETEDDNDYESEGSLKDDNESEEDETKEEKLIPGLPKPLSRSQKKRLRRNKRKNATTQPEPKDKKITKLSVTPVDPKESPSLVTTLIRKYSNTEMNEAEDDDQEEIGGTPSSNSSGATSCSTNADTTKPSPCSSVASPLGLVIPTGVN